MKIPTARKLPSGAWHIQLRLGGESISITEPTERACIKRAQLIKAEHLAGKRREPRPVDAPTLGSLLDKYIVAKRPVLSPSTVRGYEAIRRTRFGAYMDRDPARINWQRMVGEEAGTCSPKTLRNAWALVAAALQAETGAAPSVRLPQVVSDEHPYLTAEQIPVFLEAVRDRPCELAALLGLHGLRRSEMCALTWAQVDLAAGVLQIKGALVHDADGRLVRKSTNKNRSSRRTVPIMIPRLHELLQAEAETSPAAGDPVLRCHPNTIYKQINTVCRQAGLPLIGVHGLRHSFASLAHSLGLPEQETMALGGWEDLATMRKIYTHLDAAARLRASNAITDFFKNAHANR